MKGANLQFSANNSKQALSIACSRGHKDIVSYLISLGLDGEGWTPLHRAVLIGHVEVFNELLAQGADIKKRGEHKLQWTTIFTAASSGYTIIVDRVLELDNYDIQDNKDRTPLHYVAAFSHLVATEN